MYSFSFIKNLTVCFFLCVPLAACYGHQGQGPQDPAQEKRYANEDSSAPWNNPARKDDPSAPWNDPARKDDPTAPWNDPYAQRKANPSDPYGVEPSKGYYTPGNYDNNDNDDQPASMYKPMLGPLNP